MKNYKYWSEEEVFYLKQNLNKIPLVLISKELHKSYASVLNMKKKLYGNNKTYLKDSWLISKTFIDSLDPYSLDETKNLLVINNFYKEFLGKSGNRKLIKQNPKLYGSIMYYSKELNFLKDKNSHSFIARIVFIINHNCSISEIKCECGLNVSFKQKHSPYINYIYKFQPFCIKCQPKYPSNKYFLTKYGDGWEKIRDEHISKMKNHKVLSKQWFIKKYENEWENKYINFYTERVKNLYHNTKILNNNKYSKISQKLFKEIHNNLDKKLKVFYAENNGEYFINLTNKEKLELNKFCIKPDFLVNKKIIEFNGDYWHKNTKEKDELRYRLLEDLGYKVLVVIEGEYKKEPNNILKKCLEFINE